MARNLIDDESFEFVEGLEKNGSALHLSSANGDYEIAVSAQNQIDSIDIESYTINGVTMFYIKSIITQNSSSPISIEDVSITFSNAAKQAIGYGVFETVGFASGGGYDDSTIKVQIKNEQGSPEDAGIHFDLLDGEFGAQTVFCAPITFPALGVTA